MKRIVISISKPVKDFLRLKIAEEAFKTEDNISYEQILIKILKDLYGKEFTSFLKSKKEVKK
jgi:hypothetical protein